MSAPLRIGVDARELTGHATGVGRYLAELLGRWMAREDRAARRFLLYAPEPLPGRIAGEAAETRIVGRGRGSRWEQIHLRRAVNADRPDAFFAPGYTAPLGTDVPLAVTIHDISFVAHPEWFRTAEGVRRRWLTRRAAARASVIFTDSEFSRSELETHLRADPRRIRVIVPGVAPVVPSDDRGRSREPIVLYVGSLFNRRRLPDLIEAFARATHDMPGSRLVIVGEDRSWPRQDLPGVAARHGVSARTEFLSYVPDDRLAELYARASVFVFLSEYEGFGLTPLEALAAGVPPVVLDTPVAREVYQGAAVYVPRGDITAAAAAVRSLLVDRARAGALLAGVPELLRRYSWQTAADRTLAEIERIARR